VFADEHKQSTVPEKQHSIGYFLGSLPCGSFFGVSDHFVSLPTMSEITEATDLLSAGFVNNRVSLSRKNSPPVLERFVDHGIVMSLENMLLTPQAKAIKNFDSKADHLFRGGSRIAKKEKASDYLEVEAESENLYVPERVYMPGMLEREMSFNQTKTLDLQDYNYSGWKSADIQDVVLETETNDTRLPFVEEDREDTVEEIGDMLKQNDEQLESKGKTDSPASDSIISNETNEKATMDRRLSMSDNEALQIDNALRELGEEDAIFSTNTYAVIERKKAMKVPHQIERKNGMKVPSTIERKNGMKVPSTIERKNGMKVPSTIERKNGMKVPSTIERKNGMKVPSTIERKNTIILPGAMERKNAMHDDDLDSMLAVVDEIEAEEEYARRLKWERKAERTLKKHIIPTKPSTAVSTQGRRFDFTGYGAFYGKIKGARRARWWKSIEEWKTHNDTRRERERIAKSVAKEAARETKSEAKPLTVNAVDVVENKIKLKRKESKFRGVSIPLESLLSDLVPYKKNNVIKSTRKRRNGLLVQPKRRSSKDLYDEIAATKAL